jgi:hypothetical protein
VVHKPVKPVRPVGPTKPVKPVRPVGPSKPVKPVHPADPNGLVKKPVKPVRPVGPTKPVKPVRPVGPTTVTSPGKNVTITRTATTNVTLNKTDITNITNITNRISTRITDVNIRGAFLGLGRGAILSRAQVFGIWSFVNANRALLAEAELRLLLRALRCQGWVIAAPADDGTTVVTDDPDASTDDGTTVVTDDPDGSEDTTEVQE